MEVSIGLAQWRLLAIVQRAVVSEDCGKGNQTGKCDRVSGKMKWR